MCGRITQKSNPQKLGLGLTTVTLIEPLQTLPRYNGAPGQEHWIIRRNPKTGEPMLDRLWWGLIPYWVKDAKGGRKPINAKSESVASLASFRDAYKRHRCLLPIDNFFEWRAIKGAKTKQPYAIGSLPFGTQSHRYSLADPRHRDRTPPNHRGRSPLRSPRH